MPERKYTSILFALLLLVSMTLSVSATEYLFKLREDAAVLCDDAVLMTEECFEDDSPLATIGGVYTTEDITIVEKYQSLGILEYYEENAPAYLFDMPGTYEYMATLVNDCVPIGESYAQLNVEALWKLGLNGKGITVGVIDSGANVHTALVDNLLAGYNTYDSNNNTGDGVYHGTMVSGFIAGNGTNYKGVAYNAKIVPIKAFNDSGSGSASTMADGIYAAINEGNCDVINMSCGSLSDTQTLKNAVNYALSKNVPIIAASGNVNNSNFGTATAGTKDAIMYPACYDGVISVGNIDRDDGLSNTSIENDYVDVVAPGKNVTGLSNTNLSGYRGASGTSFACPIVTGIVACMLQAKPDLAVNEIETILQQTATDLGDTGFDISYGYGKVNCKAIVPKILDGKLYRSNIVEYKGTYNIAMRNGLANTRTVKNINIEFSDTGASEAEEDISLVTGESIVLEAPDSKVMKLIYESEKGYEMVVRNGSEQIYTTMLLAANYGGTKMNNLGGRRLDVQSGGVSSVLIPHYVSGSTKLFLVDVGKLTARLLSQCTAE